MVAITMHSNNNFNMLTRPMAIVIKIVKYVVFAIPLDAAHNYILATIDQEILTLKVSMKYYTSR